MSQFIGRGETLTETIIQRLYPDAEIRQQVPIKELIEYQEWTELQPQMKLHKFDFMITLYGKKYVVEVNYKHGSAATIRLAKFETILKDYDIGFINIDDFDCDKKGLFYLDSKKQHKLSWNDFTDIINQFEKSGVSP